MEYKASSECDVSLLWARAMDALKIHMLSSSRSTNIVSLINRYKCSLKALTSQLARFKMFSEPAQL